ncbi:hypothetical protein JOF29_002943 [Kribbella aluminosa]|uniref:Glycoside hydrolase family 29 N-terminal domain-containing protein n=1 Tax=Kribbella aluminosa TaxID=416017 RepID=A0ABS4UJM3_9ACTN|nr:alpha-amylase family protein [Kribbella aluminosa]MBP2351860.1 hypothetical protein [Kribbella aluminosa]
MTVREERQVPSYLRARRRMLLDMHIPGWDPAFLRSYEPEDLAELYARAGADGALIYCKSHVGLSYWPTPVGGIHPAAGHRDLVGETKQALEDRGIGVAAYHSVIFDNWAGERHPEWRTQPMDSYPTRGWTGRYVTMCANHLEYRQYEMTQIAALVERYDFDALWLDMAFWTAICVCETCAAKFRAETGLELPERVDWQDSTWCAFQAARERWIAEFFVVLRDAAREVRPDLAVTHNLAPGLNGWFHGQQSDHAQLDTFAAGDLYGGRDQETFVLALMRNLAPGELTEFMTSRTTNLNHHCSTKSEHEMLIEACAAVAYGSAFLFIDAIDPSGNLNPRTYDRIGQVFTKTKVFDRWTGGEPLEDVAVLYSDASRIDPTQVGGHEGTGGPSTPHQRAVIGISRMLRRLHVPFGVLTHKTLATRIDKFKVLVLPEAVRLTDEACEVVRQFVRRGGAVYASGGAGLLQADGRRLDDFLLADVFGCSMIGVEDGEGIYYRPATESLTAASGADPYLPATPVRGWTPRVRLSGGEALATLNLPYGYPTPRSAPGHDFASIHSSPPWQESPENPTLVVNRYGAGTAVYSTCAIESERSEAHQEFLAVILREVLELRPRLAAEAHPDVWVIGADQPDRDRVVISVLQWTEEPTGAATQATITLACEGRNVKQVVDTATGGTFDFLVADDTVSFQVASPEVFVSCAVEFTK